jgi:hypothetical protein
MSIQYPTKPWVDGQVFSQTAPDGSTINGVYDASKNAWTLSRGTSGGTVPGGVVTTVDVQTVNQRPDVRDITPFELNPGNINNQQDVNWWLYDRTIELEEEIDDLAVTAERGTWKYSVNPPGNGEFNMLDENDFQNLFSAVKSLGFSKLDSKGEQHDFSTVQVEDYIELKEDGQSDYGLFQITGISNPSPDTANFEVSFVKGTGYMEPGKYARLKIFRLAQGEDLNAVADTGDNPPQNPVEGQLWWDSSDDDLTLYIYYDGQWIPAAPPVSLDGIEATITTALAVQKNLVDRVSAGEVAQSSIITQIDELEEKYITKTDFEKSLIAPARLAWKFNNVSSGSDDPGSGRFSYTTSGSNHYYRFSFQTANGVRLDDQLINSFNVNIDNGPVGTIWYKNHVNDNWKLKQQFRINTFRWGLNNHFEMRVSSRHGEINFGSNTLYYFTVGGFF